MGQEGLPISIGLILGASILGVLIVAGMIVGAVLGTL